MMKEMVLNSWKTVKISEISTPKGQRYACESYIYTAICWQSVGNLENIKIEGTAHRSQCKCHFLTVHMKHKHIVEQDVWFVGLIIRRLCLPSLTNVKLVNISWLPLNVAQAAYSFLNPSESKIVGTEPEPRRTKFLDETLGLCHAT